MSLRIARYRLRLESLMSQTVAATDATNMKRIPVTKCNIETIPIT